MGKVKIKRKSTRIDMTAMSDVTVLLLTFFMLTSTFLQKEPTVVNTPSSVSEEKVSMSNVVTILVSGRDKPGNKGDEATEGKIYISFTGDQDTTKVSSEQLRERLLLEAVSIYNEQHKNAPVTLKPSQVAEFGKLSMFGVPFRDLPKLLDMDGTARDKYQGDTSNPNVGIPIDGNKDRRGRLNDFQIWLQAIYNVAQGINNDQKDKLLAEGKDTKDVENLYTAMMRKGQGIAVKADKDTPFRTVEKIFDNLQTMKLNKFSLMTALKSEEEPTK